MGYLAQTFCSNAHCPRIKWIPVESGMEIDEHTAPPLLRLEKSEAYRDDSGNYWCEKCQWRGKSMAWAKMHKWPAINCPPYAVAHGQSFWELALKLGVDAYAQAISDAIKVAEEV